ncbi:MAG: hypothetical protein L0Y42_12335 [Phycisphaerales bacterium]|nr:hypothetical protein [Phycisphaerales bacterium]
MPSPGDEEFRWLARWRIAAVGWCLAWLVGLVAALAVMRIDRSGSAEAWRANLKALWWFWIASGGLWVGLSVVWWFLRKEAGNGSSGGREFVRQALFIGSIAAAARVAVLVLHSPALSEDVYRYAFDGRNFAAGMNPYLVKPGDRIGASEERWRGEAEVVRMMSPRAADPDGAYAQVSTPYLPVSLYVFGALGFVVEMVGGDFGGAGVFRAAFVGLELVLIGLLFVAVKRAGKSAWWVALYAWHPLPIAEIAGSGHQDVIGILFLVASLMVFSARRAGVGVWSAWLAMSAMVKPVAAPCAVFMLKGRGWREWLKSVAIGITIVLLLGIPLQWIPWSGSPAWANWSQTAGQMSQKWAHFGGVYEPVLFVARKALPPLKAEWADGWNLIQETWSRRACMVLLAGILIALFRKFDRVDSWRATCLMLLAIVLLSTTAHPWYLLWAFALAPPAMNLTLWVYSLTISWGYVVLVSGKGVGGGEEWTVEPWVLSVAYVPVYAAVVCDVVIHSRRATLEPRAREAASGPQARSDER